MNAGIMPVISRQTVWLRGFAQKIPLSCGGFFCFRQDESVGFGHCACFVAWVNGKKPVFIPLSGFSSYPNRVDNTNG
ncbi:hypothetical protein [Cardiobacterium sp. Marseille-Q4385]|uniref:hypothetical protein n=1 Tax=Cardiobacterium sp. Marseille-Q4385 TaxID=2866573 RepID=UPI001CE4966C|nr:hypothetical protein [Cardiobacterium sp. Marseille-Q4385]